MRQVVVKPLETFLVNIDGKLYGAIFRVVTGFGIGPVFQRLTGGRDEVWIALGLFLGILILLRVIPAILRRVLAFSSEARETWAYRRNLAKQYDSYQWRKLFWMGLGLLLYAAVAGGLPNGGLAVTVICLIGGSLGLLAWSGVDDERLAIQ